MLRTVHYSEEQVRGEWLPDRGDCHVRLIEEEGAYFVELPIEFTKAQNYEAGDTLIASSETGFRLLNRLG